MPAFSYDAVLLAAAQRSPTSIADVINIMQTIDVTCVDGDGLKWFNWLYLQVTQAVETRVGQGGLNDAPWLMRLDLEFAALYFGALSASLLGRSCPSCWDAMFAVRDNTRLARIQFALAGINAHINHDLPEAIVATCKATNTVPRRGSPQYQDYTALNVTLDSLVETAKQTLHVRLLGDPLPAVSHVEDTVAAWGVSAARTKSWTNAEILWALQPSADMTAGFLDSLDGLTTVISKTLLVQA